MFILATWQHSYSQLATFLPSGITDYFYSGDKFRILLIRLNNPAYQGQEEKNQVFLRLLANTNDLATDKNEKRKVKSKPRAEIDEKLPETKAPGSDVVTAKDKLLGVRFLFKFF